jgi:hypothetical protein
MNVELFTNPIPGRQYGARQKQVSKRRLEWTAKAPIDAGPITSVELKKIRERKGISEPKGAANKRKELAGYQMVKDLLLQGLTVDQIRSRCASVKGLGERNVGIIVSALLYR